MDPCVAAWTLVLRTIGTHNVIRHILVMESACETSAGVLGVTIDVLLKVRLVEKLAIVYALHCNALIPMINEFFSQLSHSYEVVSSFLDFDVIQPRKRTSCLITTSSNYIISDSGSSID
jgi:hypothetical protein